MSTENEPLRLCGKREPERRCASGVFPVFDGLPAQKMIAKRPRLGYNFQDTTKPEVPMSKILVVEDDLPLSAGLCYALDEDGGLTVAAYTCRKARMLLEADRFDLVILDVNLPDGSGFDLCREIKAAAPELPVIFLTANDLERDELNGFDLGADDYITKPFRVQVLKRRVEAVLRRGASRPGGECFDDGFLRLDFQTLTALRDGERLAITPNEYKLLRLLTASAGTVITRRLLLEKLWDAGGNFIDDHTLTVTMNRLRAKIEDPGHTYIQTIRGMGYVWTGAPV
ncbi:response regulator transcription factor [Oscillospiraceae bacterium 38-13]